MKKNEKKWKVTACMINNMMRNVCFHMVIEIMINDL